VPWRGILGTQQYRPKWTHNFKTLQGFSSQNGPPISQGVRRPQLILACKAAEILRAMGKYPSSGQLMLTLIKASRMVCSVVAGSFLSTYFFLPNYQ
jgi:hypothetical protein